MSSRHRNRLQQRVIASAVATPSENSEKEDDETPQNDTFVHLASSSSSDSSSEQSDSKCDGSTDSDNITKREYKEKFVAAPSTTTQQKPKHHHPKADDVKTCILSIPAPLSVDEKLLCIDEYLRSRFGSLSHDTGEEPVHNTALQHMDRKQRRSMARIRSQPQGKYRRSLRRRYVFGSPKEEWPRHLPYIAGGFRIVAAKHVRSAADPSHVIDWSAEYASLHEQYLSVVSGSGGDVNTLVMFLMHHPHHVESMLQLAMVFAHTGQMDRASEMIQRCLYNLEAAHGDGFRWSGNCRLSSSLPQNRCYFTALFRHMQIASMMGCPVVAANLSKCLLLLEPTRDPYHMLLFLDVYLTTSKQYSQVLNVCESNVSAYLDLPLPIDEFLPNWSYSRCIAERNVMDDIAAAFALSEVLLRWPMHALALVSAVFGNDSSMLKSCEFFQHFVNTESIYPVLHRLADIYGMAAKIVWSREEMSAWLRRACRVAAERATNESAHAAAERLLRLEKLPRLQHYGTAQKDDFKEEFPRLPADVNPLDPQLADPRILHRVPENMRRVRDVRRLPQQGRWQEMNWLMGEDEARNMAPSGYRIDLNLPLLNIFILSIFPWFRL